MKPNTALAFLLLGISLRLTRDTLDPAFNASRFRAYSASAGAALAGLIGLATLLEYATKIDLGIDEIIFRQTLLASQDPHPGRIAHATAFAFVLFGAAVLALNLPSRLCRVAQYLGIAGGVIGLLAVVGYIYGVQELYRATPYSSVAVHTAALFVVLGLGVLCACPDQGVMATFTNKHFGGVMARRIFPVAATLPFVIGWLRLKGEQAGFYGPAFGLAMFATISILIFATLVWVTARSLNQADAERREAELSAREEQLLKAALLESSLDSIIIADQQGRIIEFNPAAEETFGFSSNEIQGKELAETIIPREYRESHRRGMAHYLATGEGPVLGRRIEISALRADGSEFPVELAINSIQVRGQSFFTASLRDITQRKLAEEALRASEERYRVLFDCSPNPMWVYDVKSLSFIAVNEAAVRLYGYSPEEFLRMTILDIRPEEDVPHVIEAVRNLTPKSVTNVTRRHRKKNGMIIEVEGSSRGLTIAGNQARIVVVNDITERKRLEDQLQQTQKMEAIGRLAGGVAHDFNNLLTAIIGYCELLLGRLSKDDPSRKEIEEVERSGKRAAALTGQLLAFSRRQMLQPKILNLNVVVSELGRMLRRLIGEDVELETNLGLMIGSVKADPGQVEQIIMNLVINARDAMPIGGKLTIETQDVYLDESYASHHPEVQAGPHVLLAVSDTGEGMDKETQARIFEPFFTTKKLGMGTGLGLATVYGIVKQSGGHIWVYSELGKGTTFKVYFPRVEEPVAVAKVHSLNSATLTGTETILLVEDEEVVRNLARDVLRASGYSVIEAGDAQQALEAAARHEGPIQLMITDVVMPGLSGRILAQQMNASGRKMKVLYMSGYTDNAIFHHGVLDPGVPFLQKPFTPVMLIQRVRQLLDE